MSWRHSTAHVTAAALALALGAPALAAEESKNMCIPLVQIDHTTTIDAKTILVEMKVGDKFKRLDLVSSCPGLMFRGFIHKTSTNDLCKTDTLTVNDIAGAVCLIDKIVDITPEEAKALKAKDKKKS